MGKFLDAIGERVWALLTIFWAVAWIMDITNPVPAIGFFGCLILDRMERKTK